MRASIVILVLAAALAGCTGTSRETTTARTAEEQLLCSTAAERAVGQLDSRTFAARRVFVDVSLLATQVDRGYLLSAFEQSISEAGGRVLKDRATADLIIEVRSAALGQWDGKWKLWIPLDTVPMPGKPSDAPGLIEIGYSLREGWCRLDAFAVDKDGNFVKGWRDNWGRAYVGFFDDIYPSSAIAETVSAKFQ
jgi:hypothetical protein